MDKFFFFFCYSKIFIKDQSISFSPATILMSENFSHFSFFSPQVISAQALLRATFAELLGKVLYCKICYNSLMWSLAFFLIHCFRDSVSVRKIHSCFQYMQKSRAKQAVLVVAFKGSEVNKTF